MKSRIFSLLIVLVVAFCIYAVARYALNLPAQQRGYDAIDYVLLHGNVQYDLPTPTMRPTDVTGVYIHEGYANRTMIELLHYLPNLRSISIGPDFSGTSAATLPSQLPKPTKAAAADVQKLRTAFPDLDVQVATFSN